MSKFFTINKKQTSVILTLVVLVFLGASYFFIYVPNNEKTVQARRFRCLQNIDNNINSRLNNSILLVNNLLQGYTGTSKDTLFIRQISNINKFYKGNFKLLSIDTQKIKGRPGKLTGTLNDSLVDVKIDVDTDSRQLTLVEIKPNRSGSKADGTTIAASSKLGIQFTIAQFINPLLPADVFDNYIVFYKNSKIYETFPSGLSYKKSDSLLEVKNGITGPGIRSVRIDGTDYKMFSQPVNIGGGEKWIVAGLVTNKNYQKEKNQLPLWIVLMLLTAALGIIVCLPWIKLYHMGNKDKLTVRDGVASVLVAMVLMSLLFFVFFKYNFSLGFIKNTRPPTPKDNLANNITRAFETELDTAFKLMHTCDTAYANSREEEADIFNQGRDRKHDALLRRIQSNINVHQVFWMDTTGHEVYNWVSDAGIPKGSDASAREYFKHAKSGKLNHTGKETFYLDQIVSKATGVFTSVISRRSVTPDRIVALGFTIKSLDNVLMPDGYQFAVIDENGKVLYHYHPALNLNVNLKTEFADSSKLISCLEAKSDTSFDAEYFGKRYSVKIKPFSDLPYHVVILEDLEYNDTRDTQAYAFTLSMLLCMLSFLIIEFIVVFFSSSKRSFFKKQLFETSWVGPKISSHGEYNQAAFSNIMIIALMVLFSYFTFSCSGIIDSSFLEYVYIILFSIVLTSIFLNILFSLRYSSERSYKFQYKRNALIYLGLFVLVIDMAAFETLSPIHFFYLLLYEAISAGSCLIAVFKLPKLLAAMREYKPKLPFAWGFTHSFALMAITRLIITSGIPVAFFFIYSYDYEQSLDTRFKQYHFAKDITQHIKPGHMTRGRLDSIEKYKSYTSGIYGDGISVKDIDLLDDTGQIRALKKSYAYDKEDYLTARILSAFRFHINTVETKNNNMNLPVVDSTAFFNKLTREKNNDVLSKTYYKIDTNKYLALSSSNASYKNPNWLLLLIAIFLFFIVMHNIIRKLFALNLPSADGWAQMDVALLKDNQLNKLLLIVGSPGSGKLARLKDNLIEHEILSHDNKRLEYNEDDPSKGNVFIADMILIPDRDQEEDPKEKSAWKKCVDEALKDQYGLIIINHLEYNVKDARTNNKKLELLEALMHKGKSKIMIISTVHPVSFLDSHNQQIRQANKNATNKTEDKEIKPEPENELERWQVLFGHFRIIIEPLERLEINCKIPVMNEIKYSHFLNKMKAVIPEHLGFDKGNEGPESDSLIFKLQLTSQYFYTYIWQSLTIEEKFLLYDLAEDGLVNSYDDYNLSLLLCKGLIVRMDGTLMLFNKGFRNFILTAIGETEANRIKEQVKVNGNWDSIKAPLGLTILAILVFLFTSQEESYSRIVTYITAFSAGIPAVLKIFSLFGGSAQKGE